MKKFISLILCLGVIMMYPVVFSSAQPENALYVSPEGNDSASGCVSEPLATLSGAKAAAEKLGGNVTVYFRQGSYTINNTVEFTSPSLSNVKITAYGDEKVVFTSGTPLTGFEECTVNGVKAFRKNVGKNADFNVLFNDKSTLPRTRYPESGYLYVDHLSDADIGSTAEESVFNGYRAMYAKAGDLKKFRNETDVVVRILHYWKDEIMTITEFDEKTNHVSFSRMPSMRINANDRYFLENVFEALNEPGEWYLDKADGVLYYIPEDGEAADTLTLWNSETETMVNVDGVDGISFEKIIFRGNGFNIPNNNKSRDSSQAAYDATPCVSYKNAKNFSIKNCEFRDISSGAVYLGYNVQNAVVDSCVFENIGAQAVYIRGDNLPEGDPALTRSIKVTNNLVSGYGRVLYNAVGILVIHANNIDIIDNEIHDGYYTAISVGWVWGYAYNPTFGNKICNNLIYDIGQGWLSDMGGIYTLGVQPGTVLSGNVIHNVAADPGEGGYGGWGIYPDEGSSEMLIEKNLVYSCGSDSYHLHYGNRNTVRNNIFALSATSQIRVTSALSRCQEGSPTAEFTSNIIVTDGGNLTYSHVVDKTSMVENGNIFWDLSAGENMLFSKDSSTNKVMTLNSAIRKGFVNNPVIADPLFKDVENFDFELDDNSPAFKAGFERIDYSEAGTNEGTVIGVSVEGGKTPYNASSEKQAPENAKSFIVKIAIFFERLLQKFRNLFSVR